LVLQNAPNPFRSTTRISYQLAAPAKVTMAVYNAAGQAVARLEEGLKPAGRHSVAWNAAGQPAGVYFYRLTAGSQSGTRRMVVVR
jgi:flagellar hook assembly protein FlgD